MKIFGQLEDACVEQLASDPGANVAGRIWWNSTESLIKTDDGVLKRALLRNDAKLIVGNHATANNNIRLHRAADGVFQFVPGGDTTAEGTLATVIAEISARKEAYTDAGKPAFGNPGRLIWVTDLLELQYDTGTEWLTIAVSGAPQLSYTDAGKPAPGIAGRIIWITDLMVLQYDTGAAWLTLANAGAAASGIASSGTLSKTANYNILLPDKGKVILVDSTGGAFNLTFPAPTDTFVISVKDIAGLLSSNPVTMVRNGSEDIENVASSYVLEADYGVWNWYSDGTDWFLL